MSEGVGVSEEGGEMSDARQENVTPDERRESNKLDIKRGGLTWLEHRSRD